MQLGAAICACGVPRPTPTTSVALEAISNGHSVKLLSDLGTQAALHNTLGMYCSLSSGLVSRGTILCLSTHQSYCNRSTALTYMCEANTDSRSSEIKSDSNACELLPCALLLVVALLLCFFEQRQDRRLHRRAPDKSSKYI